VRRTRFEFPIPRRRKWLAITIHEQRLVFQRIHLVEFGLDIGDSRPEDVEVAQLQTLRVEEDLRKSGH